VTETDIGAAVRQVLGDSLGYLQAAALRVAVQAGAADHLAEGPASAERLAALGGVQADPLRRVLRFLAGRGVFREDEDGSFHLTTAASLLRSDSPIPLRPLILLFTDQLYWLPSGRLDDAVRKGSTVFGEIFGAQFFDYLTGTQQQAELFSEAMAALSVTEQGGIAGAYGFPQAGTVVDVGGGLGGMLKAVLVGNPGLQGILFDRESVLRQHRLSDPAIEGRWSVTAGDFYESVPAGAEIYLLKRILHDKTDFDCVRVLRSCARAMLQRGRLLIIDPLVPDVGDYSASTKLSDLLMMAVFEGKERTQAELRVLLAEAGLTLSRVVPTPTPLTIVEAVREEPLRF
jgi:hypothetical protein